MAKFEDENSTAPETPAPTPTAPARALGWRTGLVAVIAALLLGSMYLWVKANPQAGLSSAARPGAVIVQPTTAAPGQALTGCGVC